MSAFVVERLHGMAPKVAVRDLGPGFADSAKNARLWSGDLVGIKSPLSLQAPAKSGTIQSIYFLDPNFLTWNEDVDVVRSPLSGLWFTEKRLHYTGHFNPKSSNESLATTGGGDQYPLAWYRLGMPAPENAPSVGNTGGSGANETRSYVYTFVSEWGEEGPPSSPTEHIAPENATSWDLSALDQEPDNSFTIDSISLGAGVVTFTIDTVLHPDGHFLETGEYITISGVTHYTGLNGTHAVTRVDKDNFTIPTPAGLATLELVTNGGFATDTDWTKGAGWTIGGGVASADGTGSNSVLGQDIGATLGVTYIHQFDVLNYVSGQVAAHFVGGGVGTVRTANGTYTEELTLSGTPTGQAGVSSRFNPNEFTGDVDNISIQEAPENWSVAREAPLNLTNMQKRIYRTDANGTFRFVDEIPASQETYTDTTDNDDLSTVELETTTWIAPPGDAKGLKALPNGSLCAFRENEVLFSEPSQPHAWPVAYRQTIDFEIVGIETWGASLVVMTKGTPYIFTGAHPVTMVPTQLDYEQACAAKRSIAKFQSGVIYASPDGLVFVGAGGPRLVTWQYLKEPDWRLYNPSSMHGVVHDDRYYAFYTNGGPNGDESGGIIFDPAEPKAGFMLLDIAPTAAHRHPETDAMYIIDASFLSEFDKGAKELQTFWRSQIFTMSKMDVIRVGRVRVTFNTGLSQAEFDQQIQNAVAEVDTNIANFTQDTFGTFAGAALGTFGIAMGPYEDAVRSIAGIPSGASLALFCRERGLNTFIQHDSVTIADSQQFTFQNSGRRFNEFYFELSASQAEVQSVALATSMGELKKAVNG